ncbi:MAG: ABC transporter permease [Clostridia bacterium]|nr:ABC transporter permease [Clostridia bacterium]
MSTLWQTFCSLFAAHSELRQIIGVTLRMACTSTLIGCTLGITLGILVGITEFRGKRAILRITSTLMSLPPVLVGVIVFFILSRSGPLGQFRLLYSVTAMVISQVMLITPAAMNLAATAAGERMGQVHETMAGIGLNRKKQIWYMLYECRKQLSVILFLGFGRAISEVGAAQLVGGNIQYKTRVMTTAIVLETNKGNFDLALALGIILLLIALVVNVIAGRLQKGNT